MFLIVGPEPGPAWSLLTVLKWYVSHGGVWVTLYLVVYFAMRAQRRRQS